MKKKNILFFIYIISILYLGSKLYNSFLLLVKNKTKDHFMPIDMPDSVASIDDSYGNIITTNKNPHEHKNCCMVKKVFNPSKNEFVYEYEKLDKCHLNMIPAIKLNQMNLFIDGVNGWNNKKCKKPDERVDKEYLGSCRRINFECKDFVTPTQCKKYNMEWSDKTCATPYQKPFKIKERTISTG